MVRLLIVWLIFSGCASVKKNKTREVSKEETEAITRQENASIEKINRSIDTEIRTARVGSVLIYPRGDFKILADGSFEGQADSVLMEKKEQRFEKVQDKDSSTVEKKERIEKKEKGTRESKRSDKEKESTPSIIPFVGIAIGVSLMIVLIGWYVRGKTRF
jgi:hypothetical protein